MCADEELRTRRMSAAHGGGEPSKALALCDTRAVYGESSRPFFKPREDARHGLFCLRALMKSFEPEEEGSNRAKRWCFATHEPFTASYPDRSLSLVLMQDRGFLFVCADEELRTRRRGFDRSVAATRRSLRRINFLRGGWLDFRARKGGEG